MKSNPAKTERKRARKPVPWPWLTPYITALIVAPALLAFAMQFTAAGTDAATAGKHTGFGLALYAPGVVAGWLSVTHAVRDHLDGSRRRQTATATR